MRNFYNENTVIFQMCRLILVFIAIFAFYIQFHGKVSPGGGFQSGIVLAVLCIVYELVYYVVNQEPKKKIKTDIFVKTAALGVLCYALTGFSCFLFSGNLFDYSVLHKDAVFGQQIGIFFIESGVGLGVFGSMMVIYRSLLDVVFSLKN